MATQSDQTNTGVVTTIVVVGSFAMITISAMVTAMVRAEHARLDSDRPTNADLGTVAALDRQQLERITAAPSWVAEPGGKVNIPIERAMSVVIDEYRKNPAAASPPPPPGMVMTPPPGPAPAPGSTSNAGSAGASQPTPATPTTATPSPAAPNPAGTPAVVPAPAAPGPPAAPATTRRP